MQANYPILINPYDLVYGSTRRLVDGCSVERPYGTRVCFSSAHMRVVAVSSSDVILHVTYTVAGICHHSRRCWYGVCVLRVCAL